MSFPVKKYRHRTTGSQIEGEVVVENALMAQVAVGGKIQVLQFTEWAEVRGGFADLFESFGQSGQKPANGGFGDLFDTFRR